MTIDGYGIEGIIAADACQKDGKESGGSGRGDGGSGRGGGGGPQATLRLIQQPALSHSEMLFPD
jgi:hypothetical protein